MSGVKQKAVVDSLNPKMWAFSSPRGPLRATVFRISFD